MKVTNLKFTRRGDRISIYIDEKFTLSLEKNLVVDLGIYKGLGVTKRDIKGWERVDMCERLYKNVLNLITRRPRSKREIYLYLERKLFKVEEKERIVQKVLLKLEKQGYIDDLSFATWWVNERMSYKPRGKFLIQQELRQKGVNHDIIARAIEKAGLDSEKEMEYALKLGKKKKKFLGNLKNDKDKRKFFNYLIGKGFGYSVIRRVYEKLK